MTNQAENVSVEQLWRWIHNTRRLNRDAPREGLTVAAKFKETSVVCVADGCMPSILMPNSLRKVRKSVLMAWLDVTDFGNFADINHRVGELEEEED